MGHVGDVDLQFVVSIFEFANVDGIVEVAGGFSVDGDDGEIAVVAAVSQRGGGNDAFDGLRFFDDGGRKAVRQVELADHDLDVDSEVGFFAENFDDAAARVLGRRRPVGNFNVDNDAFKILPIGVNFGFVADDAVGGFLLGFELGVGLRVGRLRDFHSRRDDDFLIYFFVDRLDVVVAASIVEDADYGGMSAGDGADDAAFAASVGTDVCHFDEDAVSVHGRAGGVGRNKDVSGEAGLEAIVEGDGFGDDEAEAVAMHGEAAD